MTALHETGAGWLNWVQCQKINVAKLDHNFNRWYQFVYETIFIVLGIIWKPIYFYFYWYTICYDCLSGTCAKWLYLTQCKKINAPKLNHYLKFSMMFCFGGFWYNEWARAQWVRVYNIRSQKESTKHDIACISHRIRSILQLFLFEIAPNVLILHTPQWNNPNK